MVDCHSSMNKQQTDFGEKVGLKPVNQIRIGSEGEVIWKERRRRNSLAFLLFSKRKENPGTWVGLFLSSLPPNCLWGEF